MKAEKVLQVIAIYRKKFEELGVGKKDHSHDEVFDSAKQGLEHCHRMLNKIEVFIQENRMDKVFRWLGFLQGVLWSRRIYTLTELINHNRKDEEGEPTHSKPPE